MYPPKLQPGQQCAGPLVSHNSLNCGCDRNFKESTVHMDIMDSQVNKDWFLGNEKQSHIMAYDAAVVVVLYAILHNASHTFLI